MQESKLPVIYRYDKETGDPQAFFPTEPGDDTPGAMTVYAHIGQHAVADAHYFYHDVRKHPKDEREKAQMELLREEVEHIYQQDPDEPVTLVEYQRIQPWMVKERQEKRRRAYSA